MKECMEVQFFFFIHINRVYCTPCIGDLCDSAELEKVRYYTTLLSFVQFHMYNKGVSCSYKMFIHRYVQQSIGSATCAHPLPARWACWPRGRTGKRGYRR